MRNNNLYRNTAGAKKHDTIPASFGAYSRYLMESWARRKKHSGSGFADRDSYGHDHGD